MLDSRGVRSPDGGANAVELNGFRAIGGAPEGCVVLAGGAFGRALRLTIFFGAGFFFAARLIAFFAGAFFGAAFFFAAVFFGDAAFFLTERPLPARVFDMGEDSITATAPDARVGLV